MSEAPKFARVKIGKDLQFAMHLVFIFLITVSSVSGMKVWLQKRGYVTSENQTRNARVFWPQNALAIFPGLPPADTEDAQDQDPLPTAFVAKAAYQQARTQQIPALRYNRTYQPQAQQRLNYRPPVYRKAIVRRRSRVHVKKPSSTVLLSARPARPASDREYNAYMSWVKSTLKTYQQGAE